MAILVTFGPLLAAIGLLGYWAIGSKAHQPSQQTPSKQQHVLADAVKTLAWAIAGSTIGFLGKNWFTEIDILVTGLLYVLLFLIDGQLRQGNYRLHQLF